MKYPKIEWWTSIKTVADNWSKEKAETYEDKMIREKMFQISCAIEDILLKLLL
jgi:hypothetical protein